jgi:hypothetical protein
VTVSEPKFARASREARERRPTTRDAAKFAAGVALFAIFWDAAVGHGLAWENDPYWTYWVTKTFLIFTIFGLGTAWLGIGLLPGAIITAVHTLVLTVYYWTFSPIGLPSSPDWLDLEHTWLTGLPIHFGVIYLGYLSTLWLWRRRELVPAGDARWDALVALVAGLAIVLLAGGISALVLWEWPGVQYFLVRALLTVPFVLLWYALAGRDWLASLIGAVTLAFIWATYGEFVGPLGLPDTPLRILEQEPPPATSYWLDYRDTWLIALPIYLMVMSVVFVAASTFLSPREARRRRVVSVPLTGAGAVAALAAFLLVANVWVDGGGSSVSLSASGPAQIEQGEWYGDDLTEAQATLNLEGEDKVRKVTPLEPHDVLAISASVQHPDGRTYEVESMQPLVSDPAGRHTTWWGVGVNVWHHGESGIGTDQIPAVQAEVAVFGIGQVAVEGESVAVNVPVHVMTGDGQFGGDVGGKLELDVGDPAALIPGLPDGHLRVIWGDYDGGAEEAHLGRYLVGGLVLVFLLALGVAVTRDAYVDDRGQARRLNDATRP